MSMPATAGAGEAAPAPIITDVTYRNYDGPLKTHAVRWWVVALATIRASVNKSRYGYWIPAGIIVISNLILGIGFYIAQNVRAAQGVMTTLFSEDINYYATTLYQSLGWSSLFLFVATIIVGAGIIAADNRANALLVYLAKPLTRVDYLIGKWVGVFILLATLTVVPALVLFLFFLTAYYSDGFFTDNKTLFFRMLGASLLLPALHTSLIIGFSSWTKSPRLAGSIYAAVYIVAWFVTVIVGGILRGQEVGKVKPTTVALVRSLSIDGVGQGIAMHLYDLKPQQVPDSPGGARRRRRRNQTKQAQQAQKKLDAAQERRQERAAQAEVVAPPLAPLLGIAGAMLVLPLWAAWSKIKAVEIIKG